MIDSHCHLTYTQLGRQLAGVLTRAAAAGVRRMITIGTTPDDARSAITLCEAHPNIRCAVGVHPHHAAEVTDDQLQSLREIQKAPCVLALGEIGLDYHYNFCPRPRQKEVFLAQLEMARELNRPIILHAREAIDDTLAILADFPTLRAVFHCFTGTLDEARRIVAAGYLLGFTGAVTYARSDELREVARFVPPDRFFVETDAPYLSPEPVRKQRVNEPSYVVHTARAIAVARGIALEEVGRLTDQNVARFFDWPLDG